MKVGQAVKVKSGGNRGMRGVVVASNGAQDPRYVSVRFALGDSPITLSVRLAHLQKAGAAR